MIPQQYVPVAQGLATLGIAWMLFLALLVVVLLLGGRAR